MSLDKVIWGKVMIQLNIFNCFGYHQPSVKQLVKEQSKLTSKGRWLFMIGQFTIKLNISDNKILNF